jgi:hypothetical protein
MLLSMIGLLPQVNTTTLAEALLGRDGEQAAAGTFAGGGAADGDVFEQVRAVDQEPIHAPVFTSQAFKQSFLIS